MKPEIKYRSFSRYYYAMHIKELKKIGTPMAKYGVEVHEKILAGILAKLPDPLK